MKKVLIDTSVLIEFLRVKRKRTIYDEILAQEMQPVVSFITPAELWAGKSIWQSKKKARILENLLSGIKIIFPLSSTLKLSGKLRAKYQISLFDAFIAACAIEENLSISTLNIKDFRKIKEVKILKLSPRKEVKKNA